MNGHKIYINGRYLSQRLTGVQRFANELVNALDSLLDRTDSNISVTLLLPSNVKTNPLYKKINVQKIGHLNGHAWEQIELPIYSQKGFLINLCNVAPFMVKKQLVVIHDMAVYSAPETYSFMFKLWYKFIYWCISRNKSKIATVSNFSKIEISKILKIPIDNLSVITEGREHILRTQADKSVFDKHNIGDRPYILAVSSMTPNKNFEVIVNAIKLLGITEFDFVIAGGTNPNVFSRSNFELPSTVKHVGYVSDPELKALYENALCFIFPSLYEGFGLPPMEAMACGCPVIASNQASIPEVCSDAAIYFSPKNAVDLAEKINLVMSDLSLRQDMRTKSFKRAERFSWNTAALEVYNIINHS